MMNSLFRKVVAVAGLMPLCMVASAGNMGTGEVHAVFNGLEWQKGKGKLLVQFVKPDVVRVRFQPEGKFAGNGTDVCVPRKDRKIKLRYGKDYLSMTSDSLVVTINQSSGAISYFDHQHHLLLSENLKNPRSSQKVYQEKVTFNEKTRRVVHTANGDVEEMDVLKRDTLGSAYRYQMNFNWKKDEAIYGLGSHIEDYMNLRGKKMWLCQHNLKAVVPVLNSTAGYGLLFDAGCAMIYNNVEDSSYVEMEAAQEIDYYMMKGHNMDAVVANYRQLTGECPMMPQYLFGYTQSKERYCSSKELESIVKEYRQRKIPLDMIVQDWSYWSAGHWGEMKMDPKFYPDKKALADSLHAMNCKLMISIWPNAQFCPQHDDFKKRGWILPGGSVYDAYKPQARSLYWDYANNEFFKNGFDAWWCDSSEPVDGDWNNPMRKGYGYQNHAERWKLNTRALSDMLGAERSQTYSLYHAMGIYEHQRAVTDEKRVVNLTRSSYAGQQRFSTITWNGDTYASWKSFAQMIPAGLNFMATGCPYWTIDVGAFFVGPDKWNRWFYKGEFPKGCNDPAYRELYTRMFQFATFLPMLRSHGTDTPREVWRFGNPGEPFYESIVNHIRLRYELLPYTYSLASKVTREGYTMTRALAFDFASDSIVHDIKDEFMMGPSFLVAPMTKPLMQYGEASRKMYLPKTDAGWYDYWTSKHEDGGRWIEAAAPIEHSPLYVKAGSIIPFTVCQQFTGEQPDAPYTIKIYPGADADFEIYEDAGDGYAYEQNAFATYRLHWNDKAKTLEISARKGSYRNMVKERQFNIELLDGSKNTIIYKGKALKVVMGSDGMRNLLSPMPVIAEAKPVGSVKMGNIDDFKEVQIDLPITEGPFKPTWESIEANYPGEPAWLRDAKFGIWVHFGPQAAGESGDWYARNLYKEDHQAYKNHLKRYGHPSEMGYKDVLHTWNPTKLDPDALTRLYQKSGARFLMIQGVHHDNYDLWKSKYQPWNSVNIGPKRDLLREWVNACHKYHMRYGVTFHHEYTWWWWQTAFGSDKQGGKAGVPYDGHLTLADGKGKWWEGYDPRLLYGIDLREYESVATAAQSGWSPPKAGVFSRHLEYANWYAKQWALRMMDVTENYDPDFIYTDGTYEGPFTGRGTGTGYKCNAMQTVMADYYNRQLKTKGKVDGFAIVKFRHPTNGTVNTAEFDFPDSINASQPWIREAPVGDWFYAPNFTYDSGSMIRFIIEAIARDGNVALNIPLRPDGSIEDGCVEMLEKVGKWMKINGEAVYGSKAWKTLGEGEIVNGKLKTLPGGGLGSKQANFRFEAQDIRFTHGKNRKLYAFLMNVPSAGQTVVVHSLADGKGYLASKIRSVKLLGYKGNIQWKQTSDGLQVTYPEHANLATAAVLCIDIND